MSNVSTQPMSLVVQMAQNAEVLNAAVAAEAIRRFGTTTVGQAGTTPFELAIHLGDMPDAVGVAGTLVEFMTKQLKLIARPTSPAASGPIAVTVQTPTRPSDMDLSDLFAALASNPERAATIVPYILEQRAVQIAEGKLRRAGRPGEWAVVGPDGRLDAMQTLAYLTYLADEFAQPHRRDTVTLDEAMGRSQQLLVFPFPLTKDQAVMRDRNPYGNDWSQLPDDVHEALVAEVMSGRLVVQSEIEVRRILHEVFGGNLPPYLQEIVNAYARNKGRGIGVVSRYVTAEQAKRVSPTSRVAAPRPFSGSEPQHDDEWCLERLRDHARPPIKQSLGDIHLTRQILTSVRTSTGSIVLVDCVLLDDARTSTGNIEGNFWTTQYCRTRTSVGSVTADIRTMPPSRLYQKVVELGIIDGREA